MQKTGGLIAFEGTRMSYLAIPDTSGTPIIRQSSSWSRVQELSKLGHLGLGGSRQWLSVELALGP